MASAVTAEREAQILADLRRTHAQLKAGATMRTVPVEWSMRFTLEEVDVILAAIDERDELRRQTVGDWEPDFPPVTVSSVTLPMSEEELPLGIPTAAEWIDSRPKSAGPAMSCPRRDTIHDCPLGGCADTTPRVSEIPDLPIMGTAAAMLAPAFQGGIKIAAEREAEAAREHALGREERETPPEPCSAISPPEWAGDFTRCVLLEGHEGAHFDGAFPWETPSA